MSELSFEVGKTYVTRNGQRVTVADIEGDLFIVKGVFEGSCRYDAWTASGRYALGDLIDPLDLVALAEDAAPVEEAAPEKPSDHEITIREITLDKARQCVLRDRNNAYGPPEDSFALVAQRWSLHLGVEVKPEDVPVMLIDLKMARLETSPKKLDNWVDIAGYAACGAEVAGAED